MRLSSHARSVIRRATAEVFGTGARVRLFGSRLDDNLRGGDIDLLVELPEADPDKNRHSLTMVAKLQQRLGDQPTDVLVIDPETAERSVHRRARSIGVLL